MVVLFMLSRYLKMKKAANGIARITIVFIFVFACLCITRSQRSFAQLPARDNAAPAMESSEELVQLFHEGRALIAARAWEKAADRFNSIITKYPQNDQMDAVLYWYSYALARLGQFEKADKVLRQLIGEFPKSSWMPDARSMQVEMAPGLGNTAMVVEQARRGSTDAIRIAALQSLFVADPEQAFQVAAEIVKSKPPSSHQLRESAIILLGNYAGKRALELLTDAARNESDSKLRAAAVMGLASINDESALELLESIAANAEDDDMAKAAVYAISQNQNGKANSILDRIARTAKSTTARRQAISRLARKDGDAVIDQLLGIYAANDGLEVKRQVISDLGQIGSQNQKSQDRIIDELMKVYGGEREGKLKEQAITSLSLIGNARAQEMLAGIVTRSDNLGIRKHAALQLARRNIDLAIGALSQWYDAEVDGYIKGELLTALGQSNRKAGLEKLMAVAKNDASPQMRRKAVELIGQSNDPDAAKFLRDLLKQ
jgi:HEAT repeat protein/outer membrane protein assembly factor BamD (BamD/ComL family)